MSLASGGAAPSDLYYVENFNSYANGTTSVPNMTITSGNWSVQNGVWRQTDTYHYRDSRLAPPHLNGATKYMIRFKMRTVSTADSNWKVAKAIAGQAPTFRMMSTRYGGDFSMGGVQTVFGRIGYNFYEWNTYTFMVISGTQVEVYYNGEYAGSLATTGSAGLDLHMQTAFCVAEYDDIMISYLWEKDDIELKISGPGANKELVYTTGQLPLTFTLSGNLKTSLARALPGRTLSYTVTDANNAVVQSGSFPVTETTTFAKTFSFSHNKRGFYQIDAKLSSGTRELVARRAGFGLSPVAVADDAHCDVGSVFSMYERPPSDVLCQKIGVQTYQRSIFWKYAYDGPGGTFNPIRIPLQPVYNPLMRLTMLPGEIPEGLTYGTSAFWTAWERYVADYANACVARLSNHGIRTYVVLNEPEYEGQSYAQALETLQRTTPILRSIDPNCKIIGPNVTQLESQSSKNYIASMFAGGLSNYIDALGLHAYYVDNVVGETPEAFYEDHVDWYINTAAANGIKEVWFTEQGIMNSLEQTPRDLASQTLRQQLLGLSRDPGSYNYFWALTGGNLPIPGAPDGLQHLSLFERRDRAPRTWCASDECMPYASAMAQAAVARLFKYGRFVSKQKIPSGANHIYRVDYSSTDKNQIALWSVPGASSYTFSAPQAYEVHDMMGNITASKPSGGSHAMTLTDAPQFVVVKPVTLFSDNFEDGNFTGWTVRNGSWSVVTDGDKALQSTGAGYKDIVAGSSSWTNYTVQAKVEAGASHSMQIGLTARYNPTTGNHYLFDYQQSGTIYTVSIRKKVGGVWTQLASNSYSGGFVPGADYVFKAELFGSTLKFYVNGVLKCTKSNETSLTSGCIGVRSETWGTNAATRFDDVLVVQQ